MTDANPEIGPPHRHREGLPDGIDPLGVPRERSGHEAFLVVLALVVALLALTFTLGWIVFHRLATG